MKKHPIPFKDIPPFLHLTSPSNRLMQVLASCRFMWDDDATYREIVKEDSLQDLVDDTILYAVVYMVSYNQYHMEILKQAKIDLDQGRMITVKQEPYKDMENVE